jgi:hypothetical protein
MCVTSLTRARTRKVTRIALVLKTRRQPVDPLTVEHELFVKRARRSEIRLRQHVERAHFAVLRIERRGVEGHGH